MPLFIYVLNGAVSKRIFPTLSAVAHSAHAVPERPIAQVTSPGAFQAR